MAFAEHAAVGHLGGTFAVGHPRRGAVDGLAVDPQPVAHRQQPLPGFIGDAAIRLRPHVQQQIAIFADVVHEVVNQRAGVLESGIRDEPPGALIVDRRIRDPVVVGQSVHPPEFVVDQGDAGNKIMGLVGEGEFRVPRLFLVVVVGEHPLLVVFLDEVQTEIEPHQVGAVVVHDFIDLGAPEVEKCAIRAILEHPLAPSIPGSLGQAIQVVQGTVEPGELRIGNIAVAAPVGIEPPLLEVMERRHETHALGPDRLFEFADDIALGPHVGGIPLVHTTVPEGEPVMVLRNGSGELRTGGLEQPRPFPGIELLGGEQGNEVLVAELRGRSERSFVIVELRVAGAVHVVGVPGSVGTAGRYAVETPMRIDAELRFPQPLRGGVVLQRQPRRLVPSSHTPCH